MTANGPDPEFVVQVRDRPSFGTGYLIGPSLVLTAAHVVPSGESQPSATVMVCVPGQEPLEGNVVWWRKNDQVDGALIQIPAAHGAGTLPRLPTRYGAFVTAVASQPAEAIGFPRLQKYQSVRDQEQFDGHVSPQTGAVSGRYEMTSPTPLPSPLPQEGDSSWAGMSGAAVFSGGLLVGIVRSDRRAQFGARLIATPVSALLADCGFREIVGQETSWDPIVEPVELSGFLESPYPDRDIRSGASLLRAEAEMVGFHGRAAETARLESWCAEAEPLRMLILTGQGGQGKSRLARRFLAGMRTHGWITGVLRPSTGHDPAGESRFAAIARTRLPVLIVVDYADNQLPDVRALLRHAIASRGTIRLLLVTRKRAALDTALTDPDARIRDLFADAPELALPPLIATAEDWEAEFDHAVQDLTAALPAVPGHGEPDWPSIAARLSRSEVATTWPASVLAVQLTALTALLEQADPLAVERGEPVERTLLRHEEAYWTTVARRYGLRLDRTTLRSTVAALPLVDITDDEQASRLLDAVSNGVVNPGGSDGRWLRELYPRRVSVYHGAIQPDRLAEFLLVEACAEKPDLLTRILSVAASCIDPQWLAHIEVQWGPDSASSFGQMWALLTAVRVAGSQAGLGNRAGPLLDQIERTASLPMISDELLQWTMINVMGRAAVVDADDFTTNAAGQTMLARELEIEFTADAAFCALQVASFRRNVHIFSTGGPRDQGIVYADYSRALSQLGRAEEALEESGHALDCFRDARARLELAGQLHTHAQLLRKLGQDSDAAEILREEVDLRELADQPRHLLASAFEELIAVLLRIGRIPQARSYAERALAVVKPASRVPAPDQAEAYLRALNGYTEVLVAEGSVDQALDYASRVESFFVGLPPASVDALAGCRADLRGRHAELLSQLGDHAGAATAWRLGAEDYQRLTGPHRGRDPIALAVTYLHNAALDYEARGDFERALAAIDEAIGLADGDRGQMLRRDIPDVYAQVRIVRIAALAATGQLDNAVREATRWWHRLRASETQRRQLLTGKLGEAQRALALAGRFAEATQAGRSAIAVLQALGMPGNDNGPATVTAARILLEHSGCLFKAGLLGEGAEAGARAVEVWRRLSVAKPTLKTYLAQALTNQAECLMSNSEHAEAADKFAEAVRTLRETALDTAEQKRKLFLLFDRQAYCESEAGRYDAAVLAYRQAVKLDRSSPGTVPPTDLAHVLYGLSIACDKTGKDLPEAFAAAAEALEIYRDLYYPELGPHWWEVARACLSSGTILLHLGRPAQAAEFLLSAFGLAHRAGNGQFVDACKAALDLAVRMDPEGVAVVMRQLRDGGPPRRR